MTNILQIQSIIPLLVGFLAGYISHSLAVKRDKRKEFNDYTDSLRSQIRLNIKDLEEGKSTSEWVRLDKYPHLQDHLGPLFKKDLKHASNSYITSQSECKQTGQYSYEVPNRKELLVSLRHLLTVVRRR